MALPLALLVLGTVSLLVLTYVEFASGGLQLARADWDRMTAEAAADSGLARLALTLEAQPDYAAGGESSLLPDGSAGSFSWSFTSANAAGNQCVNNLDGALGTPTWTCGGQPMTVVAGSAVLSVTGRSANARVSVTRAAVYRYDVPFALYAKKGIAHIARLYSLGQRTQVYSNTFPTDTKEIRTIYTLLTSTSGKVPWGVDYGTKKTAGTAYSASVWEFFATDYSSLSAADAFPNDLDDDADKVAYERPLFARGCADPAPHVAASDILSSPPSNLVTVAWDAGAKKVVITDARNDTSKPLPFTTSDFAFGKPTTSVLGGSQPVLGLCYLPLLPPPSLVLDGSKGVTWYFPDGLSSDVPLFPTSHAQIWIGGHDANLAIASGCSGLIVAANGVNLGAASYAKPVVSVIADGDITLCPTVASATGIMFSGLYYANGTSGIRASQKFVGTSSPALVDGVLVAANGDIDLQASTDGTCMLEFVYDPAVCTQQPYGYYSKLYLRRIAAFNVP